MSTRLRNRLEALEKRARETRLSLPPFVVEVENEDGEVRAAELYTVAHGVARTFHGEQAAAAWNVMRENEGAAFPTVIPVGEGRTPRPAPPNASE